ncbi:MAG: BtaA family protein [Bryobacteraceae bacterium]
MIEAKASRSGPHLRAARKLVHHGHDALFRQIHGRALIYNTCWEDPRLDRQMLEIGPSSRVVAITSAGCNALDYLLDDPAEIHAVDVNPRQNALLQLKIALIDYGDHGELFRVFGDGTHPEFRSLLSRISLGSYARRFWEEKRGYFETTSRNLSFYYRGAAGQAAWVVVQILFRTNGEVRVFAQRMVEAKSLGEQQALYASVRPLLWNAFHRWLVSQPLILAMMGVPRPQIRLIESGFPGGVASYIQHKIEHVLTRLPIYDNYFWRVYMTGRYSPDCCPNYLRPGNFSALRARSSRVRTHTATLTRFLEQNPGPYTHFVLLDHQDWLASHDTAALHEEWRRILQNSRPGTRILMRSASQEIDFIPHEVLRRLRFFPELTSRLHSQDRVGTYGSTMLAEVS